MTKKEAEDAEKKMIADIQKKECNLTDMTFGELFDEFYDYKKDKVKATTLRGYTNIRPKLKRFEDMKIRDFDIQEFLKWRTWISSMDLALKAKNEYYKYFKVVLNYETKWHDFNFRKSCLSVNKNITKTLDPITGKPYTVSSPKTMSSYRTIPISNFLLEYYKDLYDDCSSYYNINDNWYVFGNIDPLPETTLRDRKTMNALKVGVKDIRVHDFRHSCDSLLIDSGANITLVAKYLGYSKIDETLNSYSHMYQNRLENIVQINEVQNTKLLESKQKELPEPEETIIDYEDNDYYGYGEDLDNKKDDELVL